MNDKELSDDKLEEELDKAFKKSESQKNVFKIIRNEESSLDLRVKKVEFKKKSNS